MRSIVFVLAMLCAAPAARADYEDRLVGSWMTSAKEDRFGEGGTYVAATASESVLFAVRCIEKELTFGIIQADRELRPLTKGDTFVIKLRTDKLPVSEVQGRAISERMIQAPATREIVRAIRQGKETAMRLEGDSVARTTIFKTVGAQKAFADLTKECPID